MKNLIFSLFSIIIFSGIVFAQSSTASENSCEQFKAIVIAPPEGVDNKFELQHQAGQVEAKGIVVNPCKKKNILILKNLRGQIPKVNPQILNPFQLHKPEKSITSQMRPRLVLPLSEATKKLFSKPVAENKR